MHSPDAHFGIPHPERVPLGSTPPPLSSAQQEAILQPSVDPSGTPSYRPPDGILEDANAPEDTVPIPEPPRSIGGVALGTEAPANLASGADEVAAEVADTPATDTTGDSSADSPPPDAHVNVNPGGSRVEPLIWVGGTARGASEELLKGAESWLHTGSRAAERDILPMGTPISPERVQQISDVESAIVGFASGALGVDLSERRLPEISEDHIRFYDEESYKEAATAANMRDSARAFNTHTTAFIAVKETDVADTLDTIQHELLHRAGLKAGFLRVNPEDPTNVGINIRRSGLLVFPDTFSLLEEGLVITLTREIQKGRWGGYDSLAAFRDAPELSAQAMAKAADGEVYPGVFFGSFFEVLSLRASEHTGEDVKKALYTMHLNGGNRALHLLSEAFGNQAVTDISRLNVTTDGEDLAGVLERLNIKDETMAHYKARCAPE